jgi:hypothetical protein
LMCRSLCVHYWWCWCVDDSTVLILVCSRGVLMCWCFGVFMTVLMCVGVLMCWCSWFSCWWVAIMLMGWYAGCWSVGVLGVDVWMLCLCLICCFKTRKNAAFLPPALWKTLLTPPHPPPSPTHTHTHQKISRFSVLVLMTPTKILKRVRSFGQMI